MQSMNGITDYRPKHSSTYSEWRVIFHISTMELAVKASLSIESRLSVSNLYWVVNHHTNMTMYFGTFEGVEVEENHEKFKQ